MISTIILISFLAMGLAVSLFKHGEDKGQWNFWSQLLATALMLWLYYEAGLFDKFMQ